MKSKFFFIVLLLCSSMYASVLKVEDAYVRATPPNLPNSAGFMKITNISDEDIDLISATSDASNFTELHTHDMIDGVMKMYQVPNIIIKAHSTTVLKPGGFHVMLIGLKVKPLTLDKTVEINLKFSNGQVLKVFAPVKKIMMGMKHH